jgi:hypothetical protein
MKNYNQYINEINNMKEKEWAIKDPDYLIIKDVTMTFLSNRQIYLMITKDGAKFHFEATTRINGIIKRETKDEAEADKFLMMLEHRLMYYRYLDDAILFIHKALEFDSTILCFFALQIRDRVIKYESLNIIIEQYCCTVKTVFSEENCGVSVYLFLPGDEKHFGLFRGKFLQQDWVFFFSDVESSNL